MNRKSTPIPESIAQLQRQLDQFRSTQSRRTKLPEPLWHAAVELAREHGDYSVAHPPRLDRRRMDVNLDELDQVLDGARQAPLSEADYDKLKVALHALAAMLVRPRNTEKTSAVLEKSEGSEAGTGTQPDTNPSTSPGHGRNGAEAFGGERQVNIRHQNLKHGDRCPDCGKGNVYGQKEPKVLVRIVGQAPLSPTVYSLEREPGDQRTGLFTSGIVSTGQGQKIALYFTGRQLAGENIGDVLKRRAKELSPLIQMCDALSRNVPRLPAGVEILPANCLANGRRQFVEVAANFPEECLYVLEVLGEVYRHDAEAREGGLAASGTTADPPTA